MDWVPCFFTLVKSDPSLGFATSAILSGLVFSLGLVLVVVAGAELFTGNNLLVMACADGKIYSTEVLRNWLLVSLSNFAGAAGLAVLVFASGHADLNGGAVGEQVVKIALAKQDLPFWTAFFRGVLCNVLVCMAVDGHGRTQCDRQGRGHRLSCHGICGGRF